MISGGGGSRRTSRVCRTSEEVQRPWSQFASLLRQCGLAWLEANRLTVPRRHRVHVGERGVVRADGPKSVPGCLDNSRYTC